MAPAGQALFRLPALVALALLLIGCASGTRAPVGDRGTAEIPRSGQHTVREGDTLYRIAWQYGLDWRELARRNGIGEPYRIRPGQQIALRGSGSGTATAPARSQGTSAASDGRATAASSEPAPVRDTGRSRQAASSSDPGWRWPLEGEVVRGFVASGAGMNRGLDLRAPRGTTLYVAAPGEVVYAGSGLRGFGQLVIVKHDDTWLSAYAHNSETLVNEGEQVAANGRLAVLSGSSERSRTVHFEIRRHGDPVDPAGMLPDR